MFTDRYVHLPTELFNKKNAEIMGSDNSDRYPVITRVNPFDISYYLPAMDGRENFTKTMLYLKNGSTIWVDLKIGEVEDILNKHK